MTMLALVVYVVFVGSNSHTLIAVASSQAKSWEVFMKKIEGRPEDTRTRIMILKSMISSISARHNMSKNIFRVVTLDIA